MWQTEGYLSSKRVQGVRGGVFKYIHHMKGVAAKQSWLITYQRGDSIRVRDVFLQGFMTTVPFSDVLSRVEPFPSRPGHCPNRYPARPLPLSSRFVTRPRGFFHFTGIPRQVNLRNRVTLFNKIILFSELVRLIKEAMFLRLSFS